MKNQLIKTALAMLPKSVLESAPKNVNSFLMAKLADVELAENETSACYMLGKYNDEIIIYTVTLDSNMTVCRVIAKQTMQELLTAIIDTLKNL